MSEGVGVGVGKGVGAGVEVGIGVGVGECVGVGVGVDIRTGEDTERLYGSTDISSNQAVPVPVSVAR